MDDTTIAAVAASLLACLDDRRMADRIAELDVADAYRIVERVRALREARGDRPVGRKIGFTNTTIWPLYGVDGPMWNYIWESTVAALADDATLSTGEFVQPRIEPEIVFHLAAAPRPGMTDLDLMGCIDRVAHGFEIVQSVFPDWRFTGAESAAAFGLHGALRLGPWHVVAEDTAGWSERLGGFGITLSRGEAVVANGHSRDVLGGPLQALRFLVDEIARRPGSLPLGAGEIVTTGTLTDAQPIRAGEVWSTELRHLPIDGIRVETRL